MSIVTKNKQIFIHFPKTAGTYIERIFDNDGITYKKELSSEENTPIYKDQYNSKHCDVCYKKYPVDIYKRFLFVREPVSWYESYISFKVETRKYNKKYWFDRLIMKHLIFTNASKESFVNLFRYMLHKDISPYREFLYVLAGSNTTVFRYENLHESLKQIYKRENVIYKRNTIINRTKKKVAFNQQTREIIKELDCEIYKTFYPELV